jgi:hypothetical protein
MPSLRNNNFFPIGQKLMKNISNLKKVLFIETDRLSIKSRNIHLLSFEKVDCSFVFACKLALLYETCSNDFHNKVGLYNFH